MRSLVVKPIWFAHVLSKSRLSPQTLLPQLLNSLICVRYICDATFTLIYVTFRSVFLLSKSACFCLICIKHNLQLCNIRPSIAFRKKPTKRYGSLFQATTLYGSNFGRINYSHTSMVVRLMFFADF